MCCAVILGDDMAPARKYHVLYATTKGGRAYKHIDAENAAVAVHLVQKQVGDEWNHLLDVYLI